MTIIEGALGTAGNLGINQARRKIIMRDKLAELEPSSNPLTILLRKTSKKAVGGPKYEWREHQRFDDTTTAAESIDASTTDFDVADGSVAGVGQTVQNTRTGETMRITAISGDNWTVTRSIGSVAAAAVVSGDTFLVLATAMPENSAAPTERHRKETNEYNVTQIARDTFGASRTLIHTDLYGTKVIMSQHAGQRAIDHMCYIEKTILFEERSNDESGDYPLRTCGGINEIITDVYDFGGAFSMQAAFDALETGLRYGAATKLLVAARAVSSNISIEALDKVRTTVSEKTFGVKIMQLQSPHGMVNIIVHNLLVGPQYGLRAYLLDIDNLTFVYLKGSDTALYEGLESPGTDGEKHGFLTEFGLERMQASTHQMWDNVATN